VICELEKICREKFFSAYFLNKYARMQANDARVQAINAVHPGVDAVNFTVLLNGMCHTRA
jgi:hypothetical protein